MAPLPHCVARPCAAGQAENLAELFGSFGAAMLAGIGMVFGVLVLLFRSFFKPVTILGALPLSLAGAFVGLIVGGAELNLPAMIGLLMLMGLAAKNSILLVEHTIECERAGISQHDALIKACRERARPIVMTTFAMVAGMIPTVLGFWRRFRVPRADGAGSHRRASSRSAVLGYQAQAGLQIPFVHGIVRGSKAWLFPETVHWIGDLCQVRSDREHGCFAIFSRRARSRPPNRSGCPPAR